MSVRAVAIIFALVALPGVAAAQPAVQFGPTPWLGGQPIEFRYPAYGTSAIHSGRFTTIRQYTDPHTGRPRAVRRGVPLFYRRW